MSPAAKDKATLERARRKARRIDIVVDAVFRSVFLQLPFGALAFWSVADAHGPGWACRGFAVVAFLATGKW